jgi:hypothetical protein
MSRRSADFLEAPMHEKALSEMTPWERMEWAREWREEKLPLLRMFRGVALEIKAGWTTQFILAVDAIEKSLAAIENGTATRADVVTLKHTLEMLDSVANFN